MKNYAAESTGKAFWAIFCPRITHEYSFLVAHELGINLDRNECRGTPQYYQSLGRAHKVIPGTICVNTEEQKNDLTFRYLLFNLIDTFPGFGQIKVVVFFRQFACITNTTGLNQFPDAFFSNVNIVFT